MKRFFILALLSTLAFAWPTQKAEAVQMDCELNLTPPCNIPQALVNTILKRAAAKLGTDYFTLSLQYTDGTCTIEAITQKSYKVSEGGGSIIIIDLDDAL